jgi:arylsulfatase A-like enzyme
VPGHGVYRLDDVLPPDNVLFSKRLQEAGYATGLFGKLHVSGRMFESAHRHPNDGFDEYEWCMETSLHLDSPYNGYAHWLRARDPQFYRRLQREGRAVTHIPRKLHMTHWAAERTIDFIRRHAAGSERRGGAVPFFCGMSVFDPHNPYDGYPPEMRERVSTVALPPVLHDRRGDPPVAVVRERADSYLGGIDAFSDDDIREMRVGYHAAVALIDLEVGRVLDELDAQGIAGNTLVIFTSDHGDMLGDHDLLVKGGFFYDAGVRVPLLARWPGRIGAGTVVSAPVQPSDIAHTALAAAGIPGNGIAHAGNDLVSLGSPESIPGTDQALCLYRNSGINGTTRTWDPPIHGTMLVAGGHKLVLYHSAPGQRAGLVSENPRRDGGELYHLEADPQELNNLWNQPHAAEIKADLMGRLLDWMVHTEITELGSRGGTLEPGSDQRVTNTLSPGRNGEPGR